MASTAAAQSPADLCNQALVRMGYAKGRVGNLYDGSQAAKKFLDVYAQTRDELLRSFDWGFAQRNIALTLLKSAPVNGYIPPTMWNPATNPPLPWLFSYAYPGDCLKIRLVKATSLFVPNFDPQPNQPSMANDNSYTPPQRVILSNIPNAVMVYTGQITDPTTFDTGFVESLAAALGRHVTPALMGLEAAKMAAADEQASTATAEMEQG
jgi:hypothetical protein